MTGLSRLVRPVVIGISLLGIATAAYFSQNLWRPWLEQQATSQADQPDRDPDHDHDHSEPPTKIVVSEQAQKYLELTAKPIQPQIYKETIDVPGIIVDRPDLSDRGIVSPATGVVSTIYHVPGDTIRPGDRLFTVKLLSESLHQTQTDLFKTTQDITLAEAQKKRLGTAGGAVPESRVIEVESQITRLEVAAKAYRQELLNRGLSPEVIDGVAGGKFVKELDVLAPPFVASQKPLLAIVSQEPTEIRSREPIFELQELKVELGQLVQAGQMLCLLSNHQWLSIDGKAFRDEMPLIEKSFQNGWPVQVDFQEADAAGWGPFQQTLTIRQIINNIDPVNRTYSFLISLNNESNSFVRDGKTYFVWRFRPGQRVRVRVRVGERPNVFVIPADAVVREATQAYVFTQNVDTFERKPVRLISYDRENAVIANDGSLVPGSYVVQRAATQLNRMIKASAGGGAPKGYHMHADGSLHKNEDDDH